MSKTFNRRPYTLNTPNSSDVKTYNFTHSNWKGISIDKNFLEADQETFEDAKNVYVDAEGLLRSRPSCKITHVMINGTELSNVVDLFVFDNVVVYKSKSGEKYYLTFENDGKYLQTETAEDIKLVYANRKIFVFAEDSLNYYDVEKNTYLNADNFIYIPTTKVFKGSQYEGLESANELTNSYKIRYLFDNVDDINYSKLVGKTVQVTIGDDTYEIDFKEGNQHVFVEEKLSLNSKNFINYHSFEKYPLISVSEKDTFIISSTNSTNINVGNNTVSYEIFYTVDGINFSQLPMINDVLGTPKISKDGFHVYCIKSDDIYVMSVVDTNDDLYYTEWTPLLKTKYKDVFKNHYFDTAPWYYNDTICGMDSLDNFVVYYTKYKNLTSVGTSYRLPCRYLLICNSGSLNTKEIAVSDYTLLNVSNSYTLTLDDESFFVDSSYPGGGYYYDSNLPTRFSSNEVTIEIDELKIVPDGNNYTLYLTIEHISNKSSYYGSEKYTKKQIVYYDLPLLTYIDGLYVDISTNATGDKVLRVQPNNYVIDICNVYDKLPQYGERDVQKFYLNYYSFAANMNCKFDYEGTSILIDVGNVYKVFCSKDNSTINIESINNDYKIDTQSPYNYHNSLRNGLYFNDDVIKYTKYDVSKNITKLYDSSSSTNIYNGDTICIFDIEGNLITEQFVLKNGNKLPLLFTAKPLSAVNHLYLYTNDRLYSNDLLNFITIDELRKGSNKYILPDFVTELSDFYFSKNKTLYISKNTGDNFKWYFPKINTQEYDYNITNLHPISQTEVAVFTKDNLYYVQKDVLNEQIVYNHYKSKLQIGCKAGSDVITTFDGTHTIFASDRGIVAMTYQHFVATDEQSVSYLTDNMYTLYKDYYDAPVKIFKHAFWIVFYKQNSSDVLLFDVRNNSWWLTTGNMKVNKIVQLNEDIKLLLDSNIYKPDISDYRYYDYDGKNKINIDWYLRSQKLHLQSIDYQKNIRDITIVSVLDSTTPMSFKLQIVNYRKTIKEGKEQLLEYRVDSIRTFVKHLNCMKVNQTQYVLKNNDESYVQLPLSLSSLNIKYRITRQVR